MGAISRPHIIKDLTQDLVMSREYHTSWQPQSSERVERMNQTLKRQIPKLILETKLPIWHGQNAKFCAPRIRMAPRKDIGLFPYKMLYALPYLGMSSDLLTMETMG
jgi:hypothetical protein